MEPGDDAAVYRETCAPPYEGWRLEMSVIELLQKVQVLVDASGNKKAVLLDYKVWEELLAQLEDSEDAKEIQHLRDAGEEVIPWEKAKAELRADGVDV